jgi:hypothetical protein
MVVQLDSITDIPLKTVPLTVGSDVVIHQEGAIPAGKKLAFVYGYIDTSEFTMDDRVELRLEIKIGSAEDFKPSDRSVFTGAQGLFWVPVRFFVDGWRVVGRQLTGTAKTVKFRGWLGIYA